MTHNETEDKYSVSLLLLQNIAVPDSDKVTVP